MQSYLVGGAVRDRLLGLPVQDRDFVVVGATPEQMLAAGFTPVGKDFPVFLHPRTHEEHALARTERKTAPGYRGFVFHADSTVTLEQDLARRDLTINAMAQAEDGCVIDPFGGQRDLAARVLRHVSPAFLEDPVRILRLARFAARFTEFSVAPETMALMRSMVDGGEVDALVPERVWQECARGLMESRPSRMFDILRACGALMRLMPAVAGLWQRPATADETTTAGDEMLAALDAAAQAGSPLAVRFAVLLQAIVPRASAGTAVATDPPDTGAIDATCARLKVPVDCRDLAIMSGRERDAIAAGPVDAASALAVLERCDAFRKPERFAQMLDALGLVDGTASTMSASHGRWRRLLAAAQAVDTGAIAATTARDHPGQPMRINAAIRTARATAIAAQIAT